MEFMPATCETSGLSIQADMQALLAKFVAFIDGKPRTIQTYAQALRRFFAYLKEQGISQPQRQDVLAYRKALLDQNFAASTVQLYIIAVRQFFRWCAQEGLYPNIADKIKGMKQDHSFKKDPLTTSQARTVLDNIDRTNAQGRRDYALLFLMMTTGLRCIEVARANVEDFRACGDNMVLFVQGKGHDDRDAYVKVMPPVESAVREYLSDIRPRFDKQPLFISLSDKNHGSRMTTRSVSRIAKTRFRAAGFDSSRLTAHSLRHTAGTLALLNGATLEEAKDLLRHSKLDTTMIYSHHINRARNTCEERICKAIVGGF